jgi:triosephosphate isomerase
VPLLVVNLKAYPSSIGPGALRIGLALDRLGRRAGVPVAIAPAAADLGVLAARLRLPVLAQHVDAFSAGARTGYMLPESVAASGGRGSLVNHSEHRLRPPAIRETVRRLIGQGLVPLLCATDVANARDLARLEAPYLAVEPPELIGGTQSVSSARPEVVSGTVAAVRQVAPRTHVLCGAGVHDRTDVRRALELGAEGILVASAVTRAPDPARAIHELLSGF